ncbi:PAS domain-containing protein [Bacillus sonorensis]|nr:PAS domain-containing protein [Bacillus sonorensis]
MWDELEKNGYWQGEIWNKRKNGEEYLEWLTISAVDNDAGEVMYYVAIFSDISQTK